MSRQWEMDDAPSFSVQHSPWHKREDLAAMCEGAALSAHAREAAAFSISPLIGLQFAR
jgi:hypothetical protein